MSNAIAPLPSGPAAAASEKERAKEKGLMYLRHRLVEPWLNLNKPRWHGTSTVMAIPATVEVEPVSVAPVSTTPEQSEGHVATAEPSGEPNARVEGVSEVVPEREAGTRNNLTECMVREFQENPWQG